METTQVGRVTPLLTLCVVTLLGCATAQPSVGRDNRGDVVPTPFAELPVYNIGDVWRRSDGPYTLIKIENDLYIFSNTRGDEVHLTKALAITYVKRWGYFTDFTPTTAILKWPLTVGDSGEIYHALWHNTWSLHKNPVIIRWQVEAYEEVPTHLGRLMAFRIHHTLTFHRTTPGPFFTVWYDPASQRYVKLETHSWLNMLGF